MLKPWKKAFALLLSIVSHLVVCSIEEKSMINDDENFSRGEIRDEPNTREIYMPATIRRGIEQIISDGPYHRSTVQTQSLIDKIGDLLFHPPARRDSWDDEISEEGGAKKDSLDYIVTLEKKKKNVKLGKAKMESNARKDNLAKVDKNNEFIGYKEDKEETRKGINREAFFSKRKEVVVNENGKHNRYRDIEYETRKRELLSSTSPFEGYMRKLAQDVNGVMGDATDMLRDTGKLIHGLKRVVKGASTLSSITNHAVRYARYFVTEPENVTVDFLEEKAIIALLDAQKAANESKKAANLARIASAKAIDVERRVENAEPDLQDVKLVTPYIEATEILAGKAEKAAKLAKIEKQKTEKDFLIMNEQINKMNIKRKPETIQNSSNPGKTYFYRKQKELEEELKTNNKNEIEEEEEEEVSKKLVKSKSNVESTPRHKELKREKEPTKHVTGVKKSVSPVRKEVDIGKDAISSIAAELTKTINRNPAKKHNIESATPIDGDKMSSEDIAREEHDQMDGYSHITQPATDAGKEPIGSLNTSNEENGEKESAYQTSKPDAEESFGVILRNSIDNRDKITSYLNNQFSPKLALSETSSPELKVNTEDNAKAIDHNNAVHEETSGKEESPQDVAAKRGKPFIDQVLKSDIGTLAKEERNMILDYIDQDDSGSADMASNAERTLYKEVLSPDTTVVGIDKFHSENAVDRSKIPTKVPVNESLIPNHKSLITNHEPLVPNNEPLVTNHEHNESLVTNHEPLAPNNEPLITNHEPLIANHDPINASFISNNVTSPKPAALDLDTEKQGHKKSTIEDPDETLDPFGFNRLEDSKEGYNSETIIPDSGNYFRQLMERSYIPNE